MQLHWPTLLIVLVEPVGFPGTAGSCLSEEEGLGRELSRSDSSCCSAAVVLHYGGTTDFIQFNSKLQGPAAPFRYLMCEILLPEK